MPVRPPPPPPLGAVLHLVLYQVDVQSVLGADLVDGRGEVRTVTADNAVRLLDAQRYSANVLYRLAQAIPEVRKLAWVLARGG